MKRRLGLAALLSLIMAGSWQPLRAADPSFDCAKAESSAETLICEDALLASLDREVDRLFRLARDAEETASERRRDLIAYQRGWIKGRDDCWKADDLKACIRDSYAIRAHQLRQGYFAARQQDGQGITSGPLLADCPDFGALIGMTFLESEPALLVLEWRQTFVVLEHSASASGARYEGANFEGAHLFWIKGDEALFTRPDGADFTCTLSIPG